MEKLDLFIGRIKEIDFIRNFLTSESNDNCLLLVGAPGAGKTSLLKYIVNIDEIKSSYEKIIFISQIRIRKEEDIDYVLAKEILKENWEKYYKKPAFQRVLLNELSSSRNLFILDGIDELNSKLVNNTLVKISNIIRLTKTHSKFILSSRDKYVEELYKENFTEYVKLYLENLDKNEINNLIKSRLKGLGFQPDLLNSVIYSLHTVSFTPYLIELFILVWSEYKEYIEKLIKSGVPKGKILDAALDILYKDISIESKKVAVNLSTFSNDIPIDKLRILVKMKDSVFQDTINELSNKKLIIVSRDTISFSHQIIKEYFGRYQNEIITKDENGQLYIYVDTEFINGDRIINLLNALNNMYRSLGGSELIIREDSTSVFKHNGEYVLV